MTNLLGHLFKRTADERQRGQEMRVAVTLHNLAGNRSYAQPQLFANKLFNLRRNRRVGANRAGDFAYRHLLKRCCQSLLPATQFVYPQSQFQSEGHRLRVDAVCASRHQSVFIAHCRLGQRLHEFGQ